MRIYHKIFKRMGANTQMRRDEFTRQIRFVRFDNKDCADIIKELRSKGYIRVVGSRQNRSIILNRKKIGNFV